MVEKLNEVKWAAAPKWMSCTSCTSVICMYIYVDTPQGIRGTGRASDHFEGAQKEPQKASGSLQRALEELGKLKRTIKRP